jgi:iron complex outermembrane receptor protein
MQHPLPIHACRLRRRAAGLLLPLAALPAALCWAQTAPATEPANASTPPAAPGSGKSLGLIEVSGSQPSSLPTIVPTVVEGLDGETLRMRINAFDSGDALKYLPSLNVRKRQIGDYDHAVLASRASGTGNSARSLVYVDGILISNLLGNGASFTPRWGMVTPSEIERVDVLYGPFAAAYSGNALGAVVDFVTRMPRAFEAELKLGGAHQRFREYASAGSYASGDLAASLGGRQGALSWFVAYNHLDSQGHPLVFPNRLLAAGTPGAAGSPVTGAVASRNPSGQPWMLLGATNITHTVQDTLRVKLAYDLAPRLRLAYSHARWDNRAARDAESYLRDAAGQPVYSGLVNIGGRQFTLGAADIAPSRARFEHAADALSLKSRAAAPGGFGWELAASRLRYLRDAVRSPSVALPQSASGGAGRLADGAGSGWSTLHARGHLGFGPMADGAPEHRLDFGVQRDAFRLRTRVDATADWQSGAPLAPLSAFTGDTVLTSIYLQDVWRFAPRWKAALGLRHERWQASNGSLANATTTLRLGSRSLSQGSPKAALMFTPDGAWQFKAAYGRALRMPTVSELYQGTVAGTAVVNNDPNLRPERAHSVELSAESSLPGARDDGRLRLTLFGEATRDALYSQTNVTVVPNVTNIQNIERIRTRGAELAFEGFDAGRMFGLAGLELSGSLTYADSKIVANAKFPASVGRWQPRVPRWRATLAAGWRADARTQATLGLRYSGRQFNTLDNADTFATGYTSVSPYLVADLRLRRELADGWQVALGIDNLTNRRYWAFHPYPQRTVVAELRWRLR